MQKQTISPRVSQFERRHLRKMLVEQGQKQGLCFFRINRVKDPRLPPYFQEPEIARHRTNKISEPIHGLPPLEVHQGGEGPASASRHIGQGEKSEKHGAE